MHAPTLEAARHVGANVYLWDRSAQNRFLAHCMEPFIQELRRDGLLRSFWFDRYDARGPHLFLLFTVMPANFETVHDQLALMLTTYVESSPSTEEIDREEIEVRHRQTRGRWLCAADALPGLAANNSFLLFEQRPDAYPFLLATGLTAAEELWPLLDDLALWALRQLATDLDGIPAGAGVRWVAALDSALREAGEADLAHGYWRYHATTLLLGLDERLATEEAQVLAGCRKAIGDGNLRIFSRLWAEVESTGSPWPRMPRLVEVVLSAPRKDRCYLALRGVVHSTWRQLGIPVAQEVPLVLFALTRDLRQEEE